MIAARQTHRGNRKSGSALILALWLVLLLTLLIASFSFDLHVEADIVSYYRRRMKAQRVAQSGMELAHLILAKSQEVTEDDVGMDDAQEELFIAAYNLKRGVAVRNLRREIGEGTLELTIAPEEGRRNVNQLDYLDWEEIFDQSNVPEDLWLELYENFKEWTDSDPPPFDDPYYAQRGYEVKNAPVDTVDELLLIQGFTEEIVFGSPGGTRPEHAMRGIAHWLTSWSHGKVNINTASREVLMTLPEIDDWIVEEILEQRLGLDGEAGTRDDGFDSIEDAIGRIPELQPFRNSITVTEVDYLRITSIGEVDGVRYVVWGVMRRAEGGRLVPVYWREEPL